jgi:hypothetical protein
MKKAKMTAAALAAFFAFAAAPVLDAEFAGTDSVAELNGISAISFSRPAYAQAQEAVDYSTSLQYLPLTTHTQYFVDKDEKGVLLRSHWTAVGVIPFDYQGPKQPVQTMKNALGNYSRHEGKSFEKSRGKLLSDAKKDRRERLANGSTFFGPYQEDGDIFVRRADFRVVSFLEDGYTFLGGAHGLGGVAGRNFDVHTGRELKLTDVVRDKTQLAEAIKQQLMFDYPQSSFAQSGGGSMKGIVDQLIREDKMLWSLDPRGISFYFNPYLLGSYAEGIFTTTIFFSERPELFVKNAASDIIEWRGPQAYCMEIRPYFTMRLSDSPRDEKLFIANDKDRIIIEYCGEKLEDYVNNKEIRPVLINTYDGKKYLYVDYAEVTNNFRLRVYDLNGASPKLVGEYPMTRLASSPQDQANRKWYIMSDPNEFYMRSTKDTNLVPLKRLTCRVGKDGVPEVYEVEGAKG